MKKRRRSPNRRNQPLILIGVGLLLMIGAAVFLIVNPFGGENAADQTPSQSDIPFPEVERVELEAAMEAFRTGQAVFVDTRDQQSYLQGFIPGALNIPVNEIESRMGELDPQDWIITYCT